MKLVVRVKLFRSKSRIEKKKDKFQVDGVYRHYIQKSKAKKGVKRDKHYIQKNKEKKVKEIKQINKFSTCRAMRLEDLKPCEKIPDIENESGLCYLHDFIYYLLTKRKQLLGTQLQESKHIYSEDRELVNFTDEHFYQIFPFDRDPTVQGEIELPKLIWLNKHEIIIPPANICLALNLTNGNTTCGNTTKEYSKYCSHHTDLKRIHAELYHLSPFAVVLPQYTTYYNTNYRRDENDDAFIRTYLEFFLRLEHHTIYQIYSDRALDRFRLGDKSHFQFVGTLVAAMAEKYEKQLPAPLSVYQMLFKRFCAGEPYVKSISCKFLKIHSTLIHSWCENL